MFDHERANVRHNPVVDAALRWPGWKFALTNLDDSTEYIDHDQHLIWLDLDTWVGHWEEAVAHAVAHLDLDHHLLNHAVSVEQERDASDLAELWLDEVKGTTLITGVNSI